MRYEVQEIRLECPDEKVELVSSKKFGLIFDLKESKRTKSTTPVPNLSFWEGGI